MLTGQAIRVTTVDLPRLRPRLRLLHGHDPRPMIHRASGALTGLGVLVALVPLILVLTGVRIGAPVSVLIGFAVLATMLLGRCVAPLVALAYESDPSAPSSPEAARAAVSVAISELPGTPTVAHGSAAMLVVARSTGGRLLTAQSPEYSLPPDALWRADLAAPVRVTPPSRGASTPPRCAVAGRSSTRPADRSPGAPHGSICGSLRDLRYIPIRVTSCP